MSASEAATLEAVVRHKAKGTFLNFDAIRGV